MMITIVGRGAIGAMNTISITIGRVTGRRIRHERTIIIGRVTGRRIRRPYRPWNRSLFQFVGLSAMYRAMRSWAAPSRMMDS